MSDRKKQRLLMTFLAVATALVFLAANVVQENKYNPTLGEGSFAIEPSHIETLDAAKDVYTFEFSGLEESNNTFLFYTNHLEIFV